MARTGRRTAPAYESATQDQHGREALQWVALSKVQGMAPGDGDRLTMPLPEGYDPHRDLSRPTIPQAPLGDGRRPAALHRLRGLRGGLLRGEQPGRDGRGAGAQGPRDGVAEGDPLPPPQQPGRLGFLPLPCQQCDAAPCEPVCPVFAAVHDDEGLNDQVYNRCIGTRYCSNNCPYKVRRFNWLNVEWVKPLDKQLNPDVTVRCRGVMEKCTFCVQRIRRAEYRAVREDRPVRDGDVTPACVQTCPTHALIFGDLMDPKAEVTRVFRTDPRRYQLLQELNTKPAVAYLQRIDRDAPNPGKA